MQYNDGRIYKLTMSSAMVALQKKNRGAVVGPNHQTLIQIRQSELNKTHHFYQSATAWMTQYIVADTHGRGLVHFYVIQESPDYSR